MAKDYQQSAKNAHRMADDAKDSSARHSRARAQIKRAADDARKNVEPINERQRKREEDAQKLRDS